MTEKRKKFNHLNLGSQKWSEAVTYHVHADEQEEVT